MSRPVKRGRRTGCLASLVLLVLLAVGVLAAALGGLVLLAVRRPAGLALVVQLQSPALAGGRAELNRPLDVQALARSAAGVTRLELYADGALAGAQASSLPTGSNPLLYLQAWTPLTPGRHALVARAYDNTGLFADSNVIYVDVVERIDSTFQLSTAALASSPGAPPPSLNDVAAGLRLPVQQLLDLNPGLASSDPGAPLPPGQTLTLPRPSAPAPSLDAASLATASLAAAPGPISGSPPAPTGLMATLTCATAQLSWAGVNGVSRYTVYRLGPSDSAPRLLATVNAAAYSDSLAGLGEYRYQVAAVSAGLETLSPLVTVSTPGTCVPPALAPGTVDVHLAALALDTDAAFDGVYCYLSVDGSPFERVPRADFSFLSPGAGGLHYDLPAQLPNRGRFLLASHANTAAVRLAGECWGRSGPLSLPLGSIATDDPPAKWNGAQQQSWSRPAGGIAALQPSGHSAGAAPARAGSRARLTYSLSADLAASPVSIATPVGDEWLLEAFGLPAPTRLRIEQSTLACDELATETARRHDRGIVGASRPVISVGDDSSKQQNNNAVITHKSGFPEEMDGYS